MSMKRFKFEIELSNGSRIDAASVAETEEAALDRILNSNQALALMEGSKVVDSKVVGVEEVICPPFNQFIFKELEDEPGFFEVRDKEGMFAIKWHDGDYNLTRKITPLKGKTLPAYEAAKYMREFAEWIQVYYPESV